jgi:DNA primase
MSIDHLRGRINLLDVVLPDLGIEICQVRGHEINVRCPDWMGNHTHGDKSPSMYVNDDKLTFNCFVCGGGSLVSLVREVLNVSEEEAIVWLEEHSDLAPSDTEDFRNEIERILARHKEQLEPLPDYPPELLFQYEGFHPWLTERGVSREVALEMQIGWDDSHCGIVIPVFFKGRLVGMQTRHLETDSTGNFICPDGCFQTKVTAQYRGTNVPKYKNTPNFPRKSVLYNYDNAAREGGDIIVVESPLSVLYLMSHGVRNVVATFGSGMNPQQAQLLYPFDAVYLWSDRDTAGNKTVRDSLVILDEFVPTWLVPQVPGDKSDPGDCPSDLIEAYLKAAYPAALFEMEGIRIWDS